MIIYMIEFKHLIQAFAFDKVKINDPRKMLTST